MSPITKIILVLLLTMIVLAVIFTLSMSTHNRPLIYIPTTSDESEILSEFEFQIFLEDISLCDCINIGDGLHGYGASVKERCMEIISLATKSGVQKSENSCMNAPSLAFKMDSNGAYIGTDDFYYDYVNNMKELKDINP